MNHVGVDYEVKSCVYILPCTTLLMVFTLLTLAAHSTLSPAPVCLPAQPAPPGDASPCVVWATSSVSHVTHWGAASKDLAQTSYFMATNRLAASYKSFSHVGVMVPLTPRFFQSLNTAHKEESSFCKYVLKCFSFFICNKIL